MKRRVLPLALVTLVSFGAAALGAQSPAPGKTVQERLGYPASARLLIIHADDFGMDHSVNRATIAALEHGWITSASLLVPCPWFPEAAAWAKAHPDADIGIHLDLTSEWTPVRWGPISGRDQVRSLLDAEGYLPLLAETASKQDKPKEAERELRAQIEFARAAGVHITHLDTHMGTVLQTEPLLRMYRALAKSYSLPEMLPHGSEPGDTPPPAWAVAAMKDALLDRVVQMSPGVPADQWLDAYKKILTPLPPGVYQLIVHLAYDDDEMQGATANHPNWGAAWRQHDLDVVKSDEFRAFLKQQGFQLITWKELAKGRVTTAMR